MSTDPPADPRNQGSRSPQASGPNERSDTLRNQRAIVEMANQVERRLGRLISLVHEQLVGTRQGADPVGVNLELHSDQEGKWNLSGGSLLDLIEHAVLEASAHSLPFQPGRVYCYRCLTAVCAHSVPSRSTEVFQGYNSTGTPTWIDFGQVLLDRRHPEVDRLYDAPPRLLSLYVNRDEVRRNQLAAFGRSSRNYSVLGQVVAGYFRTAPATSLDAAAREAAPRAAGKSVFALTFQAVETRNLHGEAKLDLNVIGRTESGTEGQDALHDTYGDSVTEPIRKARRSLGDLESRLAPRAARRDPRLRAGVLAQVPGILKRLSQTIGHSARRGERRTPHAEQRRLEERPVQPASEEALRCPLEKMFADEKEGTWIVHGRKNRIHVFSPEGRLVTSLFMLPDSIGRRLRTKRWRPATAEERARFQKRLAAVLERRNGPGAASD